MRLIPAHAGKTRPRPSQTAAYTAHPRSRGENTLRVTSEWENRGLIPAHAGKTLDHRWNVHEERAHPRSRGENLKCGCFAVAVLGSSPLTRGKRRRPRRRDRRHGLIPAHAGKTAWTCARSASFRAHPRSRGENPRRAPVSSSIAGSSPLTRRKHPRRPHRRQGHRLIPAHAGKTKTAGVLADPDQAHPRSRGENRGSP